MIPATFDELNRLVGYKRSMDFAQYFGEMRISPKQKRDRMALARQLEDEFVYMVALLFYERNDLTASLALEIRDRYLKVLADTGLISQDMVNRANEIINSRLYGDDLTGMLMRHVDEFSAGIILTTMNHEDEPYYYSLDRARLMAESESHTVWNTDEFVAAEADGYLFKMWCTAGDNHVRDTHTEVEGVVVPIDEPFELAGGYVQYPRDDSLGAADSEIAGCRCTVEFTNEEY